MSCIVIRGVEVKIHSGPTCQPMGLLSDQQHTCEPTCVAYAMHKCSSYGIQCLTMVANPEHGMERLLSGTGCSLSCHSCRAVLDCDG